MLRPLQIFIEKRWLTCSSIHVSTMMVKSGIYFPYVSFSFKHNNSKFMKQIRISNKNTFALISSNVLQDFFLYLNLLFHNNWQISSFFNVSRWSLMWDDNVKAIFLKTCMIFSEINKCKHGDKDVANPVSVHTSFYS